MTTTNNSLTDAELATMVLALMNCDTAWRTTDHLLDVAAGRATREQMTRVLFGLNDAGKINYRRDSGWRFAR